MVAPTFREVLESSTFGANWRAEIKAEGEARGKAMGREEGRTEGRAEVARNLAKLGIPAETIITATQLDPEKVKALYQ
jgi:predicted transposase YdaD